MQPVSYLSATKKNEFISSMEVRGARLDARLLLRCSEQAEAQRRRRLAAARRLALGRVEWSGGLSIGHMSRAVVSEATRVEWSG